VILKTTEAIESIKLEGSTFVRNDWGEARKGQGDDDKPKDLQFSRGRTNASLQPAGYKRRISDKGPTPAFPMHRLVVEGLHSMSGDVSELERLNMLCLNDTRVKTL